VLPSLFFALLSNLIVIQHQWEIINIQVKPYHIYSKYLGISAAQANHAWSPSTALQFDQNEANHKFNLAWPWSKRKCK
jgi:hypothetical protein